MKFVFLCLLGSVLLACNVSDSKNQSSVSSSDAPSTAAPAGQPAVSAAAPATSLQWLDPVEQDLGTLQKGQVAEVTWRFKNTGSHPLYITNVRAGCGCTTPDVPQAPIAPGGEEVIRAKFNSENFSGHVTKEVYVEANNTNPNNGSDNKLTFTANIK